MGFAAPAESSTRGNRELIAYQASQVYVGIGAESSGQVNNTPVAAGCFSGLFMVR
jgi:hypothetical protein